MKRIIEISRAIAFFIIWYLVRFEFKDGGKLLIAILREGIWGGNSR